MTAPAGQPFMTSSEYRTGKRSPYVGPRSIERNEPLYGRDRETDALVDLLLAERIVLMHSPSGAGKTSLLNACVIPRLQAEGLELLPRSRVNSLPKSAPEGPWNRYVLSVLMELEKARDPDAQRTEAELARMTLCTYLDARPRADAHAPEVLVLDQFEELLTSDAMDIAAKEEFCRQLGEALKARHRWAVIAMREDSMGALAPYLRFIPTGLAHRFRLSLLSPESAKDSIRFPAEAAGRHFRPEAVDQLVQDLSGVEGEGTFVEPVHLQVVCTLIWERLSPDEVEIDSDDVAQVGGVTDALMRYYARAVARAAADGMASERDLRAWIEQVLIVQGRRGQSLAGTESEEGVTREALQVLIDRYLVRSEERRGGIWYELAHDRLVEPIVRDNRRWRDANLSPLERQAERWVSEGKPDELLISPLSPGFVKTMLRHRKAAAAPGVHTPGPLPQFARASLRRFWSRLAVVPALLLLWVAWEAIHTRRESAKLEALVDSLRTAEQRRNQLEDSVRRIQAESDSSTSALVATIAEQEAVIESAPRDRSLVYAATVAPPPPPPVVADTARRPPVLPSVIAARPTVRPRPPDVQMKGDNPPPSAAQPPAAVVTPVDSSPRPVPSSGAASRVTVEYFRKPSDPPALEARLRALGHPMEVRSPRYDDLETNYVAYGSRVPVEQVRRVALELLGAGVALRAICPFSSDVGRSGDRSRVIQVIGADVVAHLPAIPRATIEGMTSSRAGLCR